MARFYRNGAQNQYGRPGKKEHLKCLICGIKDFDHFFAEMPVENTKRGVQMINKYTCTNCNHIHWFNKRLQKDTNEGEY